MLIPLGSDQPSERTPWVTYGLLFVNVICFFALMQASDPDSVFHDWGCRASHFSLLTALTSMFLHGSFGHLFGNMLYLWLYGGDLEDRLGRLSYLFCYLATGVLASVIQAHTTPPDGLDIPCVGASGAISGILGAYTVLFPWRKIRYWFFSLFYQRVFYIWAWVTMGFWFLCQGLSHMELRELGASDGVAYAAHAGGFLSGAVAALALMLLGKVEADWGPRKTTPEFCPPAPTRSEPVQSPCPACGQELRPLHLPNMTLQECRECAAIWGPLDKLKMLLALPRLPNSMVYLSPQQRAQTRLSQWLCPTCQTGLQSLEHRPAVLQSCPNCVGALLDTRRLEEWGLSH
jgi:membrane associated rhomboid family serine protease/Zn-finger nucleic acid-binding protein